MKGKLKKSLIAILTLALTFTSAMSYNSITVLAASASAITINEKLSNEQLAITPGETKHMRIPIRALGSAIIDPSVVVSATNAPLRCLKLHSRERTNQLLILSPH
jgi:hypothetical protein